MYKVRGEPDFRSVLEGEGPVLGDVERSVHARRVCGLHHGRVHNGIFGLLKRVLSGMLGLSPCYVHVL